MQADISIFFDRDTITIQGPNKLGVCSHEPKGSPPNYSMRLDVGPGAIILFSKDPRDFANLGQRIVDLVRLWDRDQRADAALTVAQQRPFDSLSD